MPTAIQEIKSGFDLMDTLFGSIRRTRVNTRLVPNRATGLAR